MASVELVANDPKFVGLNPIAAGTRGNCRIKCNVEAIGNSACKIVGRKGS